MDGWIEDQLVLKCRRSKGRFRAQMRGWRCRFVSCRLRCAREEEQISREKLSHRSERGATTADDAESSMRRRVVGKCLEVEELDETHSSPFAWRQKRLHHQVSRPRDGWHSTTEPNPVQVRVGDGRREHVRISRHGRTIAACVSFSTDIDGAQ
uniref:Uncharacterized protein n=1 Tax=Peronospora matthiolae TaxID=2874970 RepID=A0AAV1TWC8_9STRA